MTKYEFIYNVHCDTCNRDHKISFGVSSDEISKISIVCTECGFKFIMNQTKKKIIINNTIDSEIIL